MVIGSHAAGKGIIAASTHTLHTTSFSPAFSGEKMLIGFLQYGGRFFGKPATHERNVAAGDRLPGFDAYGLPFGKSVLVFGQQYFPAMPSIAAQLKRPLSIASLMRSMACGNIVRQAEHIAAGHQRIRRRQRRWDRTCLRPYAEGVGEGEALVTEFVAHIVRLHSYN